MNKNKFSTKYLVEMALLVAIILLMAFTPIGYIKTAGLEITLIVVPVAVVCPCNDQQNAINAQNIGNFLDKGIENKYKYGCRYFGKEKTSYIIK